MPQLGFTVGAWVRPPLVPPRGVLQLAEEQSPKLLALHEKTCSMWVRVPPPLPGKLVEMD